MGLQRYAGMPESVHFTLHSIEPFTFAVAKHGKFSDYIEEIERLSKNHSVFLYIDPWTVEGLEWKHLDRVFQHLTISNMSIEILLNFNAPSFVRRGLAALKLAIPESNPKTEETGQVGGCREETE